MKTCPKCGTELLDNELFCAYCGHRMGAKKAAQTEPPQIVRTAQKGTYVGKHEVLSGEASRQRRLSSFELDAFMVVEVDIAVNHLVGFRESSWFVAVNALCLED